MSKKQARRSEPRRNKPQWPWLAGAGAVLVLILAVWIPNLLGGGQLPQEGRPIADFVATDSEGNRFQLSEAYRDNDLILVFYRGYG